MFLKDYLARKLEACGRDECEELSEDFDLFLSGVIDSLGLLDLWVALEKRFDHEIDIEPLDPEQMTIVGPLCQFVSEQLSQK